MKPEKHKRGREQEHEVLVACGSFFSPTITESEQPKFDQMVIALITAASGA